MPHVEEKIWTSEKKKRSRSGRSHCHIMYRELRVLFSFSFWTLRSAYLHTVHNTATEDGFPSTLFSEMVDEYRGISRRGIHEQQNQVLTRRSFSGVLKINCGISFSLIVTDFLFYFECGSAKKNAAH